MNFTTLPSATKGVYETKMPVILKKLTDYTVYHFSMEEPLQKKIGYAGCESHKNTHDFFVREINFQVKKLENMNKADVLNFYKYIVN